MKNVKNVDPPQNLRFYQNKEEEKNSAKLRSCDCTAVAHTK